MEELYEIEELDKNDYVKDGYLYSAGDIYKLEKETDYGYIARDGANGVAFFNKKDLGHRYAIGYAYEETKYGYLINGCACIGFVNKTFNRICHLNYSYRYMEETDDEYEERIDPPIEKIISNVERFRLQVRGNGKNPEVYNYISEILSSKDYNLTFDDGRNITMNSKPGILEAPFGEIFKDANNDWYVFIKDTKEIIPVVREGSLHCIRFKGNNGFYALYDKRNSEWQYNICQGIKKENNSNKKKILKK